MHHFIKVFLTSTSNETQRFTFSSSNFWSLGALFSRRTLSLVCYRALELVSASLASDLSDCAVSAPPWVHLYPAVGPPLPRRGSISAPQWVHLCPVVGPSLPHRGSIYSDLWICPISSWICPDFLFTVGEIILAACGLHLTDKKG